MKKLIKRNLAIIYMVTSMAILAAMTRMKNLACERTVFLSVGQGDSCIMHTAFGKNYVVDGGSSSNENCGKYVILPALKYYGMSDIDAVFISHTDSDHVNGINYIMENYVVSTVKIKDIYIASGTVVDNNFSRLIESAKKNKVNIKALSVENQEIINDKSIKVLYPSETLDSEVQGNERSIVLFISGTNTEYLFSGDIGFDAEKLVAEKLSDYKKAAKTRILKVPHHGSRFSSSEELLDAFNGDVAVISVGKNNFYGHPTEEAMQRISSHDMKILRTDINHAIIIEER